MGGGGPGVCPWGRGKIHPHTRLDTFDFYSFETLGMV